MTAEITDYKLQTRPARPTARAERRALPFVSKAVVAVRALPAVECPVRHHFAAGFYLREIFMPRGAVVVSKKHLTEHQFVISKGRVSVWDPFGGVQHLQAPYVGLTKPGTQRVLFVHEDCVWTTAHAAPELNGCNVETLQGPAVEKVVAEIEARIIERQTFDSVESIEPEILKELENGGAEEIENRKSKIENTEVVV